MSAVLTFKWASSRAGDGDIEVAQVVVVRCGGDARRWIGYQTLRFLLIIIDKGGGSNIAEREENANGVTRNEEQ